MKEELASIGKAATRGGGRVVTHQDLLGTEVLGDVGCSVLKLGQCWANGAGWS